jgi:outer membrane immunogenic protein
MLRSMMIGVVAAGSLAVGSGAAFADGMPARAAYKEFRPCANWAGIYGGGHLGGAWAKTDLTWVNDNFFNIGPGDRSSIEPSSFIAGVHGGAQHQVGCFVMGLEGSFSGGDITKDVDSPFFPGIDTHSAAISRVTTFTGRLGYSWQDWMLYGKGGYAGARVELFAHTNNNFGADAHAHSDRWQSGWTVGGGLEYQLKGTGGKAMVLGLEYNYINLGTATHNTTCDAFCGGFPAPIIRADVDMHVVTGRVTFLLGRDDRIEPYK